MTTRALPTDRNGNVCYGPRTFAQAESAIDELARQPEITTAAAARKIHDRLVEAGFAKVAARVAREYEIGR
jgi:hypothetical protein